MHNTLVPYLETSGEIKTKPTQHSVKELTGLGIQPDALLLRSHHNIDKANKKKVALFCNVDDDAVISVKDVDIIYEVALNLQKQHLDDLIVNHLRLNCEPVAYMDDWVELIKKIKNLKKEVNIALVGKYVKLHDAYLSVYESLKYAGYVYNTKVNVTWVDSEELESIDDLNEVFKDVKGIIVPGGFGSRGVEGKIKAIKYARENNIPFLGLCLGMQLSLIEIARDLLGYQGANSTEFDSETNYKIIDYLPNQYKGIRLGGTMRLGEYDCEVLENTKAFELYNEHLIQERHRHRYEFNNIYKEDFERVGVTFSGVNPQTKLCEIIELKDHPFFIACQFHPEFKSRPLNAHPLFKGFIEASINKD